MRAAILWVVLVGTSACGDTATCPERSLRFLAPDEGAMIVGDEVTLTLEACQFEHDEVVEIQLLEPVESNYGFITIFEEEVVSIDVPTLPGTMRFVAFDEDGTTRSAELTIQAER